MRGFCRRIRGEWFEVAHPSAGGRLQLWELSRIRGLERGHNRCLVRGRIRDVTYRTR